MPPDTLIPQLDCRATQAVGFNTHHLVWFSPTPDGACQQHLGCKGHRHQSACVMHVTPLPKASLYPRTQNSARIPFMSLVPMQPSMSLARVIMDKVTTVPRFSWWKERLGADQQVLPRLPHSFSSSIVAFLTPSKHFLPRFLQHEKSWSSSCFGPYYPAIPVAFQHWVFCTFFFTPSLHPSTPFPYPSSSPCAPFIPVLTQWLKALENFYIRVTL